MLRLQVHRSAPRRQLLRVQGLEFGVAGFKVSSADGHVSLCYKKAGDCKEQGSTNISWLVAG